MWSLRRVVALRVEGYRSLGQQAPREFEGQLIEVY